ILGGNRAALTVSAGEAHNLVPLLAGTTFAKDQTIDVANGIPFVAYEYAGGRSLRHIVDRARGGNGVSPNPIPLDQAIVIAEKIALSLATTADLRYLGNRLAHGALIPQFVWITDEGEIRAIIEKAMGVDPNARYATIGDMKQVLSALVHGGNYSASTFNLAFYLSNLLKKELEGEALERERESKVNVAAYAEIPMAAVTAMPSSDEEPAKSRMPLYAAAAAVVVAVSAGAYFILKPKPAPPVAVHKAAPPPKPLVISQPVIAAAPTTTAPLDPASQKKAFEAAVQQKMQEEMMKLQSDMNRQLKQQQSKNA